MSQRPLSDRATSGSCLWRGRCAVRTGGAWWPSVPVSAAPVPWWPWLEGQGGPVAGWSGHRPWLRKPFLVFRGPFSGLSWPLL